MTIQPPRPPAEGRPPSPAPAGNWPAVASLVLGIVGFLVGLYLFAFHGDDGKSYTSGGYPPSYVLLWSVVLPCGILGILLGIAAFRQSARKGEDGMAGFGLALGLLVVLLAIVGIFITFMDMAGLD